MSLPDSEPLIYLMPPAVFERWGRTTGTIVNAALRAGAPVRKGPRGQGGVDIGDGATRTRYRLMGTTCTAPPAWLISGDKAITNEVLQNAGIPIPNGNHAHNVDDAAEIAREIGYPLVMKPTRSGKGRGVFVGVEDEQTLRRLYNDASHHGTQPVMVEEIIEGNDYRILVINDRIAAAMQRSATTVIGDGTSTIVELIEQINQEPRRAVGPIGVLAQIKIDDHTIETLRAHNLAPGDILEPGREVPIKSVNNISQGGISRDVTDLLHPDNVELSIMAAQACGADIIGVDLITSDIGKSAWETGGAFCEINCGPGFMDHLAPGEGTPRDVGQCDIEMLYPPGTRVRGKTVLVASTPDASTIAAHIANFLASSGERVGLTSKDRAVLDGIDIPPLPQTFQADRTSILNNPEIDAAVVEFEAFQGDFDLYEDDLIVYPPGSAIPPDESTEAIVVRGIDQLDESNTRETNPDRVVLYGEMGSDPRLTEHVTRGGRAIAMSFAENGPAITLFNDGRAEKQLPYDNEFPVPAILLPAIAAAVALSISINSISSTLHSASSGIATNV